MRRKSSRMGVVVATVAVALAGGPSGAQAATVTTPPLTAERGGYLECKVTATSTSPIGIVAKIVRRDGANVTDFGTGFRASPEATGDGLYYAEETAGALSSSDDGACYCKAAVTGARMKDVHVILQAHAANGDVAATREIR